MYNTTAAVKAALGQSVVHMRLLSESVPDGRIEGEQLTSLSYSAGCCDGDICIGSVSAASLSGSIHGALNLLGVNFTAQVGVDVEGVTQWLNLGTFTVTECSRTDDSTTFTAYDAAYTDLGAVYTPTVQSGVTVYAVLEDLADQCGLDVEQTTLNLGLSITVTGTLTGHTCREMVGYLAALCGKNAVITRDGFLRFVFVELTEQTVTADDYYSGALSNGGISKLWGISCTVPTVEEEQTLTVGDAGKAVTLSCPYMTQAQLNAIWNTIGGYEYPVGNVSFYRGLLTEPGDLVSLTNLAGVTITLPAMQVSLEIDGGCRCTISSFGKSEAVRSSDSPGPTEKRLQSVQKTASRAMQSANGKNKVFHQASAPAASDGLTVGDLWFNTALGNQIATWDGSQWSAFSLQDAAISNLDAGSITTGTLNAARIDVADLFAQDIAATGTISGLTLIFNQRYFDEDLGDDVTVHYILDASNGSGLTLTMEAQADQDEPEAPVEVLRIDRSSTTNIFGLKELDVAEQAQVGADLVVGGGIDVDESSSFNGNLDVAGDAAVGGALSLANNTWNTVGDDAQIGDVNAAGKIGIRGLNGPTGIRFVPNVGNTDNVSHDLWIDGSGTMRVNGNFGITGGYYVNDKPYIKVKEFSFSTSCGAGATNTQTGNIEFSGYTPIGVIGYNVDGTSKISVSRIQAYSNNQVSWRLVNQGSSAYSGTIWIDILYMAT